MITLDNSDCLTDFPALSAVLLFLGPSLYDPSCLEANKGSLNADSYRRICVFSLILQLYLLIFIFSINLIYKHNTMQSPMRVLVNL